MPSWLRGAAAVEWARVVELLERGGLLAVTDLALLAAYCEAWAEFERAAIEAAKEPVVTGAKGNVYLNPWVGIKNRAAERLVKLAARFGLSPADRVGLKPESASKENNKKDRFFQPRIARTA